MDFILCDLCGVSKLTQYEIREHKRKAHDSRKFTCDQCNKDIIGNDKFKTHLKSHQTVLCAHCNKEIKRYSCNSHIKKCIKKNQVQGEKQILRCEKCGKFETPFKQNLKRHQVKCEIPKIPKTPKTPLRHLCTICDQVYESKFLLKKHIKENHEPKKVYHERHGYKVNNKGSEAHIKKQHKFTVSFNSRNVGDC